MPLKKCYICQETTGRYQRLEVARLRFIRKAHPGFQDNSVLCLRCFQQFEKIYKLKSKKSKPENSHVETSIATISSTASISSDDKSQVTTVERSDSNNNGSNQDRTSNLVLEFDSRSMTSSVDSTDRIVQMVPDYLSLRDSSRKTTKNPELIAARIGADAALKSVVRRQNATRDESTLPEDTPVAATKRNRLAVVNEESSEDEDLALHLSPDDLAHTRPIVKRRKQPVVQQFGDVMDLYIKSTSGG